MCVCEITEFPQLFVAVIVDLFADILNFTAKQTAFFSASQFVSCVSRVRLGYFVTFGQPQNLLIVFRDK